MTAREHAILQRLDVDLWTARKMRADWLEAGQTMAELVAEAAADIEKANTSNAPQLPLGFAGARMGGAR